MIGKLHKELTKRIQVAKEHADEESLLQDDEAGKENNNDNAAAANATKPIECEDAPATDSTVKEGDSDEPCTKKRLSSSS